MRRNLLNLYVWLVDTIRRHRRITLSELNRLWMASEFSQGQPLSRRSFANYRIGAEELFKISILCDLRTFEYYIDDSGREDLTEVASWLLDSAYTHDLLINSRDLADRIPVLQEQQMDPVRESALPAKPQTAEVYRPEYLH